MEIMNRHEESIFLRRAPKNSTNSHFNLVFEDARINHSFTHQLINESHFFWQSNVSNNQFSCLKCSLIHKIVLNWNYFWEKTSLTLNIQYPIKCCCVLTSFGIPGELPPGLYRNLITLLFWTEKCIDQTTNGCVWISHFSSRFSHSDENLLFGCQIFSFCW